MNNVNILVVGAYGQLGSELRRLLETGQAEIGPIPGEYANCLVDYVDFDVLDITKQNQVQEWFVNHNAYDLVINCAAYTNVDACEQKRGLAFKANSDGPRFLAREAGAQRAKFVQVSTDYVFPGTESAPRCENDETAPISAYGRTKLSGELAAVSANSRTFIVRTAWLYGYTGHNFVKTMLKLGVEREEVTVVDDQFGNPTSANDLAYEILCIALTENYGIYHCTNEGVCSWADFAQAIMEGAGLSCVVKRCSSEEYATMNPTSAKRPHYSALENKHLAETIGNEMRPWQEALATYLENLPTLEASA